MKRPPLCIVNPKAGSGRGRMTPDALMETARKALGELECALTERSRHADLLAFDAAKDGRELVIATGGDGSIHEVVNGLMRAREAGHTNTTLGIIGRGTGSDFCKTLGFEPRLDKFLSVLSAGHTRRVDIGQFRYADPPRCDGEPDRVGYFVNILSAGMGGLVDRLVHDSAQWLGGKAGYFVASARALAKSRLATLRIDSTLDGVTTTQIVKTRQIAICNGRYFGGGMFVAPMADPSDGIFDVVDLGAASKLKFAIDGGAIYKGEHLKNPDVKHFRCQKVRFTLLNEDAREVFLNDADGEPLGGLPLEVEVVKDALSVMVPRPH